MPAFSYKASNSKGEIQEGIVEASNKTLAENTLHEQGLTVISLEAREKPPLLGISLNFFNRITAKDKLMFFRQFATMIEATLPVLQALKILSGQTKKVKLKDMIDHIIQEVEGGSSLSAALAQYPHIFSEFYIGMIRAGETSGNLDQTLLYLADQTEKDYDLMSKVKGAMIYPAFIVVGMVAVGILMMIFVIPQLTSVLEEGGQALPFTTRILVGTSKALKGYWWAFLGGLLGLVVGGRILLRYPSGQRIVDFLKIKIPVVSMLFSRIYLVRFTRNLSTLLAGGVPIGEALKIVSGVMDNWIYSDACLRVRQGIESGESLARIFKREPVFPPIVSQMARVGERTGRLVDVLKKLSEFYDREVNEAVKGLVSLIEPAIMVILGLGVAVMVSAILLPIYGMANAV
ncbi:MAG: type II secretion system F family protein [Candidatus Doudnabacteria bacterium]